MRQRRRPSLIDPNPLRTWVAAIGVWLTFVATVSGQMPVSSPRAELVPTPGVPAAPREPSQFFYDGQVPDSSGPFTPEWKPRWLQEFRFDWNGVTSGGGAAAMNDTELALESTLAAPWIVLGSPWLITPHFGIHLLQGPTKTDMPGHLFDAWIEFGRLFQLTPRLQLETAYAPSLFSDFDQGESRAFRVTARVVGYYELNTTTQLALGATYLARYDYPVLPVAGFIWAPNDLTRVEAVFPRPKFQQRLFLPCVLKNLVSSPLANKLGYFQEDEYWWYLRGDLGGNTYAIRRATGDSDMVTYREFRLVIGYERRGVVGIINRNEIGWSFSRDLKYSSSPQHFPLHDGLLLRSEYAF